MTVPLDDFRPVPEVRAVSALLGGENSPAALLTLTSMQSSLDEELPDHGREVRRQATLPVHGGIGRLRF
jgi:hypothetical protein